MIVWRGNIDYISENKMPYDNLLYLFTCDVNESTEKHHTMSLG